MFKKKPPTQSQSIGGSVAGSQIQMAQAGGDITATQRGHSDDQTQGITTADVLQLLEKLETAVKASGLNEAQQDEVLDYLKPAKREAGKEAANKNLVGENLKQVSEAMKNLKDTSEAGKSLWQTGTEVLKAIAPWLGVASHFFGL
jgi:truncated hemoglobin YjbI